MLDTIQAAFLDASNGNGNFFFSTSIIRFILAALNQARRNAFQ
jgi:hypothetical protein